MKRPSPWEPIGKHPRVTWFDVEKIETWVRGWNQMTDAQKEAVRQRALAERRHDAKGDQAANAV